MQQFIEVLPLLWLPFLACLIIASLHCYMGLHVIRRGVIFVDLALAQCAALGAAVALLAGPYLGHEAHHHEEHDQHVVAEAELAEQLDLEAEGPSWESTSAEHEHSGDEDHHDGFVSVAYASSLAFALLGAVVLSVARLRDERIPHEALIGIIFVVSAALTVLILSKAPHGHERMEAMLVGSILFVSWPQLITMLMIYLVLGAFHIAFRRPFLEITSNIANAEAAGRRVRLWDSFFYGSFALMVTQSVGIAGVFVVFSFLIIPAACASLFADRFATQLIVAWIVALLTTLIGLFASAVGDIPTGPSLVACFGTVLVVCAMARKLRRRDIK